MLLPCALRFSFFMATGPMLARWSALGAVMMVSQMTAWFVAFRPEPVPPADGHSAVT
jgi:anti-sigma factor RsiW